MERFDRRNVKDAARNSIARASYSPQKLILIHTGCIVLSNVLVMLISALLMGQMDSAGGLGGMGKRAALSTAQELLMYAQIFLLPFWQIGLSYAYLLISRREHAGPGSLLQGFRHMGPVLRMTLLQGLIYLGVGFLASNIASFVFTFFPQSETMVAVLSDPSMTEEAIVEALMPVYPILLTLMALAFIPLFLPMYYRYRMASFCLMDAPHMGAKAALRRSKYMMYGSRIALFKLDLSFWWFFALEILVAVIAYCDSLLPLMGIPLPMGSTVSYYLFFILSSVCQLALYWWKKGEVDMTYAHVYHALSQPRQEIQNTVIDV